MKLYIPVEKLSECYGRVTVGVNIDSKKEVFCCAPGDLVTEEDIIKQEHEDNLPKRNQIWRFKSTGKLWVIEDVNHFGGVRIVGIGCCKYFSDVKAFMEVAENTGKVSAFFEGLEEELK